MESKPVVYPGDSIGVAEEWVPGRGTYEEKGEVFAAMMGRLVLDTNEFEARVEPFVPEPAALRKGDVVIGTIQAVRSSMAIVAVQHRADMPEREVAGDTNGTLHVSKASEHYVESMESAFRVRDIIRAVVLETTPAIQLSTKGEHYGVLKSYCARCGTPHERKGVRGLACPECDWKETSKLAEDFGHGHIS